VSFFKWALNLNYFVATLASVDTATLALPTGVFTWVCEFTFAPVFAGLGLTRSLVFCQVLLVADLVLS